jgi:hypothetical protein
VAEPAFQHAGEEQLGQVDRDDHVQLQHVVLALPVELGEPAVEAVAGVVDQHVDRPAGGGDAAPQLLGGAVGDQVEHGDLDGDAVAVDQLALQRPQPVLAPGHQEEAGAAAGQLAGEVGPQPAGGAGDQRVPSLQGAACHPLLLVRCRRPEGHGRLTHNHRN